MAVAVLIGSGVSACTPRPDGPAPTAQQFFARLATGDTTAAAQLTDRPDDARNTLNSSWAGLQATHLDAQVLSSGFTEDTGTVDYRYTWHLPKDRTWTYDGQLNMVRNEGRWEVRWAATGLHPKLGDHQTLELRGDAPKRASVNELGGTDVLRPGNLYRYSLDAKLAGPELMSSARAVIDALHPFDNTLATTDGARETAAFRIFEGANPQPTDRMTAYIDVEDIGTLWAEMKDALTGYERDERFGMAFTGQQEDQMKEMAFLGKAFLIAIFIVFLIIVWQFNSISWPLVILSTVLFSTIGVFLGLIVFRMDFIILMSMLGIISLIGVVVNNAIVLMDFAKLLFERQKEKRGLPETAELPTDVTREMLIIAGKTRLRPVLLTAVTAVLGLLPLAEREVRLAGAEREVASVNQRLLQTDRDRYNASLKEEQERNALDRELLMKQIDQARQEKLAEITSMRQQLATREERETRQREQTEEAKAALREAVSRARQLETSLAASDGRIERLQVQLKTASDAAHGKESAIGAAEARARAVEEVRLAETARAQKAETALAEALAELTQMRKKIA